VVDELSCLEAEDHRECDEAPVRLVDVALGVDPSAPADLEDGSAPLAQFLLNDLKRLIAEADAQGRDEIRVVDKPQVQREAVHQLLSLRAAPVGLPTRAPEHAQLLRALVGDPLQIHAAEQHDVRRQAICGGHTYEAAQVQQVEGEVAG